jgi:hypothetical protein
MAYDPRNAAGLGTDQLDDQASMPLLNLIQQNSPQVNKQEEKYIEGASAGDIFFAPTGRILEQPIEFTPTAFRTVYVEWIPRAKGGGIVGIHPLTVVDDPAYEQGRERKFDEWLGANQLKKTTYVLGLIKVNNEITQAMLALSVTGQKVSRKLQGDIRKFRYDGDLADVPPAVFARSFKITSIYEKNKDDEGYYNWKLEEPRVLDFEADEDLLTAAEESATQSKLMLPSPQEQPRPALAAPEIGSDVIVNDTENTPY